jgi:hypothetical protein
MRQMHLQISAIDRVIAVCNTVEVDQHCVNLPYDLHHLSTKTFDRYAGRSWQLDTHANIRLKSTLR